MSDQAKLALSGKIRTVFPAEVYGNFEKRVVWIDETVDDYPQTFAVEFTQGNCNLLDGFKEGDNVEININLRGRHWQKGDKEGVFNTLQGWRIKRIGVSDPGSEYQQAKEAHPKEFAGDDLPF